MANLTEEQKLLHAAQEHFAAVVKRIGAIDASTVDSGAAASFAASLSAVSGTLSHMAELLGR